MHRHEMERLAWIAEQERIAALPPPPPPPTAEERRAAEHAENERLLDRARRRLASAKKANAEAELSEIRRRHLDNLAELEFAKEMKRLKVRLDRTDT